MCELKIDDIKQVKQSVMKNEFLKTLLEQKRAHAPLTENIFDFDELIPYLLSDCLIEFITEKTKTTPHTYANFIKELNASDSSIKRHFDTFLANIKDLQTHKPNMPYCHPFVNYISKSLIPNNNGRDKNYRNYNYIFFNASFYYYVMCNDDLIPFFCRNQAFPFEKYEKLITFFSETHAQPLTEQWICQHYTDKYFSPLLFTQTLNVLNDVSKTTTWTQTDTLPYLYWQDFLSLCNLIENSSGILIKEMLFDRIKRIFCEKEQRIIFQTPISPKQYFEQCAIELMIWNDIISPYVKQLYDDCLNSLLKKRFPNPSTLKLYKQFDAIIPEYDIKNNKIKNMLKTHINDLNKNWDKFLFSLQKHKKQPSPTTTNYLILLNNFYHTSPFKIMADCRNQKTYTDFYEQASLDLKTQIICRNVLK